MGSFHIGYLNQCPKCSNWGSVEGNNTRKGTYLQVNHYENKSHRKLTGICYLRYIYSIQTLVEYYGLRIKK